MFQRFERKTTRPTKKRNRNVECPIFSFRSLTVLSHCGHWPQLERAATFNKLSIDFLSHVDSK